MKRTLLLFVIGLFLLPACGVVRSEEPKVDPFALENRDPRSPAPPGAPVKPMNPPVAVVEPAANPGEAWIILNGQRVLVKVEDIQPVKARTAGGDNKQRVDFT